MPKTYSLIIVLISLITSCLDPFTPQVGSNQNLLVIDGLITNEPIAHRIKLSRSANGETEYSEPETGASVIIVDDQGDDHALSEVANGIYETDPSLFLARPERSYTLKIRTSNGARYASQPASLPTATTIDSVFYDRKDQWNQDLGYFVPQLSFYINSSADESGYVRWIIEESWSFQIPFPDMFVIAPNDSLIVISPENVECWKHNLASTNQVFAFDQQTIPSITKKEIYSADPLVTDRFTQRYSFNVKQLSLSKNEYSYWNQLNEVSEDGGDIFGKQPYTVTGNVFSEDNPNERVLGYFQVNTVTTKRIFVDRADVSGLNLSLFTYSSVCSLDSFMIDGFAWNSCYEIYVTEVLNGNRSIGQPVFNEMSMSLTGLLLTRKQCSDCTLTGTSQRPDFWKD